MMMTGIAAAQNPTAQIPTPDSQMSIPDGYSAHGTVDLGGHMAGITGSTAMYDTLVKDVYKRQIPSRVFAAARAREG